MWYEIAIPVAACLISIIAILISINSHKIDKTDEKMKDFDTRIDKKADKEYVDKQLDILRLDISKTIVRIDNNLLEIRSYIINSKN